MAAPPGSALRSRRRQSSTPVIDECVAEFIKRTVQKMSMAELMTILRAWGFLTERELQSLPTRTSKENIAVEVVHLCEAKQATLNHAADLDIIYNHSNSKKTWAVYQMTKPTDSEMNHIDVSEFKARFKKAIHAVTKNVTIHFKDFGEAMWIRLAWGQLSMKPNQYKPTFVVYHTQTPYAFFTNLSRSFQPVLCQGLLSAATYSHIQEMDLKSRCLDSLKDIVFKRFNQLTGDLLVFWSSTTHKLHCGETGAVSCFTPGHWIFLQTPTSGEQVEGLVLNLFSRWEKSSGNPDFVALYHEQLFHKNLQAYHPRPLQERNYTPAIVDSRVTYENHKEKERVHHLTRETFGDGSLPKLEHASYRLETTFKGEQGIAEEIEPFRCVVKFSSPNLLESIRSLAPSGVAEAPISNLLSCIPHRARNLFKISEKKPIQPTSSQATTQ